MTLIHQTAGESYCLSTLSPTSCSTAVSGIASPSPVTCHTGLNIMQWVVVLGQSYGNSGSETSATCSGRTAAAAAAVAAAAKSLQSDSVRPHRQQPTRLCRPWDSPGKNTSGLPFPSPIHGNEKWKWSRSVVSNSSRPHGLQPTRLLHPWGFQGKSTGVGCHCLLQSLFLLFAKCVADVTCPIWKKLLLSSLPLPLLPCSSHLPGKGETSYNREVSSNHHNLSSCFFFPNFPCHAFAIVRIRAWFIVLDVTKWN